MFFTHDVRADDERSRIAEQPPGATYWTMIVPTMPGWIVQ
jgi:hypothetical protein